MGRQRGRAEQAHAEDGGLEQARLGQTRRRHGQAEAEHGGEARGMRAPDPEKEPTLAQAGRK